MHFFGGLRSHKCEDVILPWMRIAAPDAVRNSIVRQLSSIGSASLWDIFLLIRLEGCMTGPDGNVVNWMKLPKDGAEPMS